MYIASLVVLGLVVFSLVLSAYAGPKKVAVLSPAFLFIGYYSAVRLPGDALVAYRQGVAELVLIPASGLMFLALGAVGAWQFRMMRYGSVNEIVYRNISEKNSRAVAWFLVGIGMVAAAIYFYLLGATPILAGLGDLFSLEGSSRSMHEMRRAITHSHRYGEVSYFGQGYFRIMFLQVMPLAIAVLICSNIYNYGVYGKKEAILLAIALMLSLVEGRIWPSVQLLVTIGITLLVVKFALSNNKSRFVVNLRFFKGVFLLSIALFSIVIFLMYLQSVSGREGMGNPLETAMQRLYGVPTARLFDLFPDPHPFRFGQTWLNDLRGLLPGSVKTFRYESHEIVYGSAHGFTLAPTIFGSLYVNFGWPGVVTGSVLIGAVVQYLSFLILKNVNAVNIAIFGYFSARIAIASTQDITTIVIALIMLGLFFFSFYIGGFFLSRFRYIETFWR